MRKICFAIPTWNRADKLERNVQIIVNQILDSKSDACIFVSDDGSDDDTVIRLRKLKSKYDFIDFCEYPHAGLTANAENLLRHAEGEYIWTFGDDDMLLPGGLVSVMKVLNQGHSPSVIHAGHGWFRPHTGNIYSGNVFLFSNKVGLNQFIGWQTSLIMRRDLAKGIIKSWIWEKSKMGAYPYLPAILAQAANQPAIYINAPIAQPMEQQNQEDIRRWGEQQIGWRYFVSVEAICDVYNKGGFTKKPNAKFFQYLNYYLWDRFLVQMIATELRNQPWPLMEGRVWPDYGWNIILAMADMIEEDDMAKMIRSSVASAKSLCELRREMQKNVSGIERVLSGLANEFNKSCLSIGLDL
jgi:abequosyltransferase